MIYFLLIFLIIFAIGKYFYDHNEDRKRMIDDELIEDSELDNELVRFEYRGETVIMPMKMKMEFDSKNRREKNIFMKNTKDKIRKMTEKEIEDKLTDSYEDS